MPGVARCGGNPRLWFQATPRPPRHARSVRAAAAAPRGRWSLCGPHALDDAPAARRGPAPADGRGPRGGAGAPLSQAIAEVDAIIRDSRTAAFESGMFPARTAAGPKPVIRPGGPVSRVASARREAGPSAPRGYVGIVPDQAGDVISGGRDPDRRPAGPAGPWPARRRSGCGAHSRLDHFHLTLGGPGRSPHRTPQRSPSAAALVARRCCTARPGGRAARRAPCCSSGGSNCGS